MNWKPVIIGALISLTVTIIGGTIVYYLTRDKPTLQSEKIIYDIESPISFTTDNNKLKLQVINVQNEGGKEAENLRISIRYDKIGNIKIIDKKIEFSSGPSATYTEEDVSEYGSVIIVPFLTPNEKVKISYLTEGAGYQPIVSIKSNKTIAEKKLVDAQIDKNTDSKIISKVTPIIIPILGVLQVLIIMIVLFLRKRYYPSQQSVNNTAFLLIHKGLYERGKELLQDSIKKDGASSIELSNYGLCEALDGNIDIANSYSDAAEFYSNTSHEKAIVAFNRGLIGFSNGDEEKGVSEIKKAFRISKKVIEQYLTFSSLVADLRNKSKSIDVFFSELRG